MRGNGGFLDTCDALFYRCVQENVFMALSDIKCGKYTKR